MAGNPVLRLAAMVCGVWVFLGPAWASAGQIVTLPLQTRDEKNQPHIAEVRVDAARIGVVVMDMWDKHWDPLATHRVAALVPRMNQFLHNARAAGAQVIFSPSNTVQSTYGASRQRQAVLALPRAPLPKPTDFQPAKPIPWTTCPRNMDGTSPYHSPPRGVWSNQCYGLDIEEGDWITADDAGIDARQELWNLIQARQLTHLLYVGVHTNWCVSNRPNGVIPMKRLGMATALVWDLTDAWSDPFDGYERDTPRPDITPNKATQLVIEHQERYIQPTVPSTVFPETVPVRPVLFRGAWAEYSQPDYPVTAAIDGSTSRGNGWGNGGNPRGANAAVFHTQEPVGGPEGSVLTFVLDFTSNPNHGLGRFRLAVACDGARKAVVPNAPGREGTGPEAAGNGSCPDGTPPKGPWTVLRPERVRSLSAGTEFCVLDDGSVLVTATGRPSCDRYVMTVRTELRGIRAFRLEALQHESLPKGGPGLRETNGNFVLGEFSVRIRPARVSGPVPGPAISSGVHLPESLPEKTGWRGDAQSLRLAIEDLIQSFGSRYPKGPEYLARLEALQCDPQDGQYGAKLAALAQEALLANPLLEMPGVVLVKRRPIRNGRPANADLAFGWDLGLPRSSAGNSALPRHSLDNEIVLLKPVHPAGKLTTIYRPPGPEFVGDVDLHFDAQRLLFSMPDAQGRWHIYEIGIDGNNLRRLTPELPDVDHYDGCYLPDGGIVFCSTACFQGVPCNFSDVAVLYRLDGDGKNIRQLCFEQDHDFNPVVMPSGRIMYLRWEYSDLPHTNSRILFSMNPDGTGQAEYYGSNSYWPNGIFGARPIPDRPGMFVGIVAGHHGSHREGELVLFDAGRGRHEASGAVQRIPGRGQPIEPLVRDQLTAASWPKFVHPYPLSDKYFLVTCKLDPQSPWDLYLADVFDNLVRVHHVEGYALFEPIPCRPTPHPPVIPPKVDLRRRDALVFLADVYRGPGLAGVPRGTVKRLRLFTCHFAYRGMGGLLGTVGLDGPWDIKRVLGTVPVEPDGSAFFRVPANTPISVQPLDAQGKALQLMRSWFVGMPGETVTCIGCHEPQSAAPPAGLPLPAGREPAAIEPWYGPPRNFSFKREVQPVLDRYCVGCHDGRDPAQGGPPPDLRGTVLTSDYQSYIAGSGNGYGGKYFSVGYFELSRFVRRPGIESDLHLLRPGEYHADTTELVRLLTKGHHGVQLDAEAWDRLITWIDLNCPYHGTWTEIGWNPGKQRAARRELRRRCAGVDEDPEALADMPAAVEASPSPLPAGEKRQGLTSPSSRPADKSTPLVAGPAPPPPPGAVSPPWNLPRRALRLADGVTMEFVLIPAGRFMMGDAGGAADERPEHPVSIDQPFWLGCYEVTNRQYACFDPGHDSRFESKNGYQFGVTGYDLSRPDQPVVRVSWAQAREFCRWMSARTGLRCTLPTEAQWEYACRAGSRGAFWFGELGADFSACANMADVKLRDFASDPYTIDAPLPRYTRYDDWIPRDKRYNDHGLVSVAVGRYRPNPWGLCDMHGNVWEWTLSAYRPYPYDRADGREHPTPEGLKVIRGGSWRDRPWHCRSASRWRLPAWQPASTVGFRVTLATE